MKVRDLVLELIAVSEKAACLARTVRAEKALFSLLVQEKTGTDKNKRFLQDFKTLADVLVQETVKHDLIKKIPSLSGHIHGEENNKFTNAHGETVTICIQDTPNKTAKLLEAVLDEDAEAARLMADVVHQEVLVKNNFDSSELDDEIPDGSIGIWIDPIDSTGQYIKGLESSHHESGVYTKGLQSVLVLIGAYNLCTGNPILGVINQPFTTYHSESSSWSGSYWWGVSYNSTHCHSTIPPPALHSCADCPHVLISASEQPSFYDTFSSQFSPLKTSGGGYKLLCVALGLAPFFVLSRSTCFKWDTCSPHAILRSQGGGVLSLRRALAIVEENSGNSAEVKARIERDAQLNYDKPDQKPWEPGQKWANHGGVLAYTDIDSALVILKLIAAKVE